MGGGGSEWVSAKLETWLPGADSFKKTELLLVGQELRPNAEETFGHGGDAWRRGRRVEAQRKIKEHFDVMVVTVGNWSGHKNTLRSRAAV